MPKSGVKTIQRSLKSTRESTRRRNEVLTETNKAFDKLSKKERDRQGQVETPIEVVDFINRSVAELVKKHFGAELKDCTVLDPMAGDGRFAMRMFELGLVPPEPENVESWELNPDVARYGSEKVSKSLSKLAGKPVQYDIKVKDTFLE